MLKRLTLILISLLLIINTWFAEETNLQNDSEITRTNYENLHQEYQVNQEIAERINDYEDQDAMIESNAAEQRNQELEPELENARELMNVANDARKSSDEYINWTDSDWDLSSPWFSISVWDITPWSTTLIRDTTEQTINNVLWTIIQKLMIGLGSVSLLIMTIWAWYMIVFHGQDELLSKWKYIFMSWIIALVVALSSYYIVSLLRYLLYSWT